MYNYLHLNYQCNLNCTFCASDATNSRVLHHVNDNKIKEFISCVQKGDAVHISGGEPTIDKRLLTIVSTLKKKGASIAISTNALKLSDNAYLTDLIESGVSSIAVSIFAINPISYNRYTRSKHFFKYMQAIENLSKSEIHFILKYLLIDIEDFNDNDVSITSWLKLNGIESDEYQISGLHLSNKVLKDSKGLIYTPEKLSNRLNRELDHIDIDKAYIQEIPLCYLNEKNLKKYIKNGVLRATNCFVYDKLDKSGIRKLDLKTPYSTVCEKCDAGDLCSVLNPNNILEYYSMGYEKNFKSIEFE